MIRVRPVVSKPDKRASLSRKTNCADEENIRPISFNTKGYFDPSNCTDEEYLKQKQRVFEKYRQGHSEIVMLDVKDTNRLMMIQRGLVGTADVEMEKGLGKRSLLREYLLRKERHAHMQMEKFLEVPKLAIDTLSLRNNTTSSRTTNSRQITSRISTSTVVKIQADF